jgi:hypothetical protein
VVPTVFGAIVFLAGVWLLTKPVAWTFALMIVCAEFGATSAITLTALGSSTISPSHLALGFVLLRILIDRKFDLRAWLASAEENLFLLGYVAYAAATAFLLPRLFQGGIMVVPLKDTVNGQIMGPSPLAFSNQNITTSAYLIGTAFVAVLAGLAAKRREAAPTIVGALLALGWIHAGFGALDLLLTATHHQGLLDVFRNSSFAQLSQEVGGLRRIAGVEAETSAYAQIGLVLFVFATELWTRGILVGRSGPLALILFVLLVLTTSSSAYIGLGVYAVILSVRVIYVPGGARSSLILSMVSAAVCGLAVVLAVAALEPHLWAKLTTVLADMTVNKHNSLSGRQRAALAQQGLKAFSWTRGLGVGAGSFRSSSLFAAVLGSTGVIGAAFLGVYFVQLAKPFRRSTYSSDVDGRAGAGAAAGWAALVGLAPLMFTAASPDPGLIFGLFAGLSIGWRATPPATGRARQWRAPSQPGVMHAQQEGAR